jgi:hypothetical protein
MRCFLVNAERYTQYGRALTLIDALEETADAVPGCEILRELAQAMLLTRAATLEEVEDVSTHAALALTQMTTRGAVDRDAAAEIWDAICACGPA